MINDLATAYLAPVYEFVGQPVSAPYTLISKRVGFGSDTMSLKRHTIEFYNHRWEPTFMVAPQNSGAIMAHMTANQFTPFEIIIPQLNSDPEFIRRMRSQVLNIVSPAGVGDVLLSAPYNTDIPSGWSIQTPVNGDIIPIQSITKGQPFSSGFDAGFWGVSIVPPYSEISLGSPLTEAINPGVDIKLVPVATGIVKHYNPGASRITVTTLRFPKPGDELTGRLIRFSSHPKVYIVRSHDQDGVLEIFPPLMNAVSPSDTVRHWDVKMRVRYNDEKMAFGMTFSDGIISDPIKISLIEDI